MRCEGLWEDGACSEDGTYLEDLMLPLLQNVCLDISAHRQEPLRHVDTLVNSSKCKAPELLSMVFPGDYLHSDGSGIGRDSTPLLMRFTSYKLKASTWPGHIYSLPLCCHRFSIPYSYHVVE